MKKKMLLLNIMDNDIQKIIKKTCNKFNINKPIILPHITLRGPFFYKNKKPSISIINKINLFIKKIKDDNEILKVDGIDIFKNNDIYIIYLKVVPSKLLRELTFKKHFPIKKYGFHPHITILSTKDELIAFSVKKYLNSKKIKLNCTNVEWQIHTLKSSEKNIFNIAIFS